MFVALAFIACACGFFPTNDEIDQVFVEWSSEVSLEKRTELIWNLLDHVCVTNDAKQGEVASYALDKLRNAYDETRDESILIAIDSFPKVTGGFENDRAGLYAKLLKYEECRAWYCNHPEAKEHLYSNAIQAMDRSEIDALLSLDE